MRVVRSQDQKGGYRELARCQGGKVARLQRCEGSEVTIGKGGRVMR